MSRRWTTSEAAAVIISGVIALVINTLPVISGVLAREVGFQASALGMFGSAEVSGIAVGSLLAIFTMRRISPRETVALGLLLLVGADAGSMACTCGSALISLRSLGGVGTGLAASACNYVFALKDRERNYGASMIGITALGAPALALTPWLVNEFGWRAMFAGLAVTALLCLPLSQAFPITFGAQEGTSQVIKRQAPRWIMCVGFVSVTLFSAAQYALWAYLERIGVAGGLSEPAISNALSMATVFGLVSSVGVLVLGERVAYRVCIASVVAANAMGAAVTVSKDPWVYAVGAWVFYFSLPLYFAALFGLIMRRAQSKRFAAQFTLAVNLGAIGPAIGGLLAEQYGVGSLRWLEIAMALASGLLLWIGFLSPWVQGFREQTADAG